MIDPTDEMDAARYAELAEKADDLGTGSSIRDIAREELGMVDPGTVIIDPKS